MTGGGRRDARWEAGLSVLLAAGVLIAVLVIAGHLRLRWDLTEDSEFSLSPATRDLLAGLDDRLQLKLYFNRDIEGAERLLPARMVFEDLLAEIAAAGAGRVSVETVDPTADLAAARAAEQAGIEAIALPSQDVGGLSVDKIYQGLEMRYQDRSEVIPFLVPNEFEFSFAVRLAELMRSERPAIGIFSREPPAPPPFPGLEVPPSPDRIYGELRQVLARRYAVRDVDLREDDSTEGLAVLVVARPENVTEEELFEIDQFLCSGGHVLLLYDHEKYDPPDFSRTPIVTGLDDWLAGYGVTVAPPLVWDRRGFETQLAPQYVDVGEGRRLPVQQSGVYGFIPVLGPGSLANEHVVTAALDRIHLMWSHLVAVEDTAARLSGETLLRSSPEAWQLPGDVSVELTLENLATLESRARRSGPPRSLPLAAVLSGSFPSFFSGRPGPEPEREVISAAAPGLLVVFGDSDLFTTAGLLGLGSENGNRDLAANLLDWMVQDESLIALRTRGKRDRPLEDFFAASIAEQGGISEATTQEEIDAMEREAREARRASRRSRGWSNVLLPPALVALLGIAHFGFYRWRSRRPYRPLSRESA